MAKKVVLVGKGNLTNRQYKLLNNALNNDFEIVKQIDTLNDYNEIPNNIDVIVTFLMVPMVINILNTYQKFNPNVDIYVFKIKQLGTYDSPDEYYEKFIADIKYTKNVNGNIKYVYSVTESILKNPSIRIEYEEEIGINDNKNGGSHE